MTARAYRWPLFVAGLIAVTALTASAGNGPLPTNSKFRGKTFEEWNVLQNEWAIATGLGEEEGLSDTVKKVRFLPPNFGDDVEFDVEISTGTGFVSPTFFVFGELYDDGTQDNPEDPIIDFILETTYVESTFDGELIMAGTAAELFPEFGYGITDFDMPIFYAEPQPRGPNLNSIAALFTFGVGAVYGPQPPGEHTLVNHVDSPFFGTFTITYHITVTPGN